jgi:hypothetical protein
MQRTHGSKLADHMCHENLTTIGQLKNLIRRNINLFTQHYPLVTLCSSPLWGNFSFVWVAPSEIIALNTWSLFAMLNRLYVPSRKKKREKSDPLFKSKHFTRIFSMLYCWLRRTGGLSTSLLPSARDGSRMTAGYQDFYWPLLCSAIWSRFRTTIIIWRE